MALRERYPFSLVVVGRRTECTQNVPQVGFLGTFYLKSKGNYLI